MQSQQAPRVDLTALADELVDGHPEPYRTLREDTLHILDAALSAVQPDRLLHEAVDDEGRLTLDHETFEFEDGESLTVLVVGKGSRGFASAARDLFPEARGLVIDEEPGEAGPWPWYAAGHPIPDETSVEAGRAALELVRDVGEDETLLVLLSGGASSVMELPAVPLEDLQLTTNTLLASGVTVHEMNMVRKHLSEIKGGQLAAACEGRVITLAISDVPHDRPGDIGSGPTAGDPTTFQQTLALVERLGEDNLPPVVVDHVRSGAAGKIDETPRPDELDVRFHLLATNDTALDAAEREARTLGYRPKVVPSPLEGEARVVGESLGKRLVSEERALLAGGETTVALKPDHEGGPGLGGRNQELTLASALSLEDAPVVACSFGTDGIDGPTDAAGAIADGRTLSRGLEAKRDAQKHLEENDSYTFFAALGDLIRTGSTGTNVMDLFVGLTKPP